MSRIVKHAGKSIKRDEKHNKSIKREEEYGDDDMQDDTLQAEMSFESAMSNDDERNKYLEMLSQDRYLNTKFMVYAKRMEDS